MKPRELLSEARNHWRVTLLVILLSISLFLLFAPLGGLGPGEPAGMDGNVSDDVNDDAIDQAEATRGITNLQWGLQLSGGTSIRAPFIGFIAEDLSIEPGEEGDVSVAVADALGVDQREITVRADAQGGAASIETTNTNVTRSEFGDAVREAGFDVSDDEIRRGVHSETREDTRRVLTQRVNEAGLSGASVDILTRPGGERLISVEIPNIGQQAMMDLIGERGLVEVWAHFPEETENGTEYRNVTVLSQEEFGEVGSAQPGEGNIPPYVPVRVDAAHSEDFTQAMNDYGFAEPGGTHCTWDAPEQPRPDDPGYCLLTVVDGEVVYAGGVSGGLAEDFRTGDFIDSPDFRMETTDFADAQRLSINLNAGSLPAELDFDSGSMFFLEPGMADEFRYYSLIVAIFAALAVAGMVYWRYRDARVAVPMIVTASSEVLILLAFAVIVPIPLDLAHIAGFIAVLGTGVDDLVIIADEIMQRGEIRTDRVFENRFRKAFWVIGVAAATTILAMSPLVAIGLGELTGFAIVTIIGVLIGVTITRPAYGNILRILMLD